MVCARLQGHIDGGAPRRISGLLECNHLRMVRSRSVMPALTDHPAGVIGDNGPNSRVGMGMRPFLRQLDGAMHQAVVDHPGRLSRATVDAISGARLLLGELFHLHRNRRRLPLGPDVTHVGRGHPE